MWTHHHAAGGACAGNTDRLYQGFIPHQQHLGATLSLIVFIWLKLFIRFFIKWFLSFRHWKIETLTFGLFISSIWFDAYWSQIDQTFTHQGVKWTFGCLHLRRIKATAIWDQRCVSFFLSRQPTSTPELEKGCDGVGTPQSPPPPPRFFQDLYSKFYFLTVLCGITSYYRYIKSLQT